MNTIRTILAVTTITTLAACSNAPSESEINKAIKSSALKEGCKTIAIKDVKKINGMKVDENNYLIKSEFTMVVAKDSNYIGKYQAYKDINDEEESVRNASKEEMQPIINKISEIENIIQMYRNTIHQGTSEDQRKIAYEKIEEAYPGLENAKLQLEKAEKNAYQKTKPYREKIMAYRGAMNDRAREIQKECVDFQKNAILANDLLGFIDYSVDNKALINGAEKSYTYEFTMIKTDNGWVSKL